jgi:hypothetical protein
MKVVLNVHEAKAAELEEGLPAEVEIEGMSGRVFKGEVSRIATMADSQNYWLNPNLKEYKTEVKLAGEFTNLKPGTTARVRIRMAELNGVLAVPVQSVYSKAGHYYVFREASEGAEPVDVQIGLSSNEYAEVKSGLQPGDRIHLSVTDEMKLKLPDGVGNADGHGSSRAEVGNLPQAETQPKRDGDASQKGDRAGSQKGDDAGRQKDGKRERPASGEESRQPKPAAQ